MAQKNQSGFYDIISIRIIEKNMKPDWSFN